MRAVPYSHSCSIPKAASAVAFSHRCSLLARRRCALRDDLLRPGDGACSGDGARHHTVNYYENMQIGVPGQATVRARHHTVDAKKRELFSRATWQVSPPSKAWPCLSRQQQHREGPQPTTSSAANLARFLGTRKGVNFPLHNAEISDGTQPAQLSNPHHEAHPPRGDP